MRVDEYHPEQDIPSLAGKVILVTGGTSGFGYETVRLLAKHDAKHIIFTGRNHTAAKAVIDATELSEEKISFMPIDMTSLGSVKAFSDKIIASFDRLDLLIENAALGGLASENKLTDDGYEPIFGTNYVAHALLARLLLPLMDKTATTSPPRSVRLVCVSSMYHKWAPGSGISYTSVKAFTPMHATLADRLRPPTIPRYGQSKLANVLLADEVARRYPKITAVSLHPGVCETTKMNATQSWFIRASVRLFAKPIAQEQGAYNQLWAATNASEDLVSGGYYDPVGVPGDRHKNANEAAAAELWRWTEAELQAWLS